MNAAQTVQRNVAIVVLTVLVSTALAAWAAYAMAQRDQERSARTIAEQVLARNERITTQVYEALREVNSEAHGAPCAAQSLSQMTRTALRASLLQAVVYIEGNTIRCGSLDLKGQDVGMPDFLSPAGFRIRPSRKLPIDPQATYRITQAPDSGYAVIVLTDLAFDITAQMKDSYAALLSKSTRVVISKSLSTPADAVWLKGLPLTNDEIYTREGFTIAALPSKRYEYTAVVALPTDRIDAAWRGFLRVAVPLGMAVGGLLGWMLVRVLRKGETIASLLRRALRREDEMFLHYQPFVDIKTGNWIGVEALLRWRRSNGEMISPALFIPVAEQSGLISEVTSKVLRMVRQDMGEILARHPEFFVSINLPAVDLADPEFGERLDGYLRQWSIARHQLHIEVTEHSLIDTRAAEGIARLKRLGLTVALDDFGTGYSSLARLADLELDTIKIDKAFVDAIGTDSLSAQMTDHIIQIGHSMGKRLIAEGIETQLQHDYVATRNVHVGQGWLYAKAMGPSHIAVRLEKQLRQAQGKPA